MTYNRLLCKNVILFNKIYRGGIKDGVYMGVRALRGAFAFNNKLTVAFMGVAVLLMQPVYAIVASQSASAVSGITVVTPAQMNGWVVSSNAGGMAEFVSADSTLGDGALRLTTTSSNTSDVRVTKMLNVAIADLTKLTYDSKVLAGPSVANTTFRLGIDLDNDGVIDMPVVYETYYNFTAANPSSLNASNTTSWQTWDVLNGKFWGMWNGGGGYDTNKTLSEITSEYPEAKILRMSLGLGSWNPDWQTLADNVNINGQSTDFEPQAVAPCTETSAVHSTSLENWDLNQTRSAGSNEIVADGLHVMTTPSEGSYPNEFSKAAGYFATNFPLSQAGSPSITFDSYTGVRPSLQLGVDKDGNGSWDGYLVYEPWAYGEGNFWSSKNFGIASGMGYTSFGTLNDYLAANPNAVVTSIGYSLGSGVVGEAVISEIVAGCVSYTFGLPVTPEEPVVTPPVGGEGQNSNGGESVRVNTASTIQVDAPSVAFTTPQSTSQTPTNAGEADQATDSSSDETSVAGEQDNEKAWSLINVLLAIGTVILSIISVAGLRSGEEDSRIVRLLTIIPAVAAVVAVLVLEDFAGKLGWVNAWTLLFAVIIIAQVALYANSRVNEQ